VSRHGLGNAGFDLGVRAINRLLLMRILDCFYAACSSYESGTTVTRPQITCTLATRQQLRDLSLSTILDLPSAFVEEACDLGHECYVVCVDGAPACYCWFSSGVTALFGGLEVSCPEGNVYAYKAFTHPAHRGRGLLTRCFATAMHRYAAAGCKGLVTVIERNNVSSVRAFQHCGFSRFGTVFVARPWGRTVIVRDTGTTRFGFRVLDNGKWP
jgi:GNAT superfamily N-acetyltransferase